MNSPGFDSGRPLHSDGFALLQFLPVFFFPALSVFHHPLLPLPFSSLSPTSAFFFYFFHFNPNIGFLHEPVYACTGHHTLFSSSSSSSTSSPLTSSPSLLFVSQYNWQRRSAPCRVCLNAKAQKQRESTGADRQGRGMWIKEEKRKRKGKRGRTGEQTA